MTISNPIMLSSKDAATFLGLSPSTLAKMRLNGNGPIYCKLGRRVLYRREDLEAWLASRVARNTSDADARLPKSLTGERVEKANCRLKANAETAPIRPKQASPGSTPNTNVRLSKTAIGKSSRNRDSGTCKY
jgi:predicted DNA-binding transcriptional regulator AlpA